jgi:hypothetical protein
MRVALKEEEMATDKSDSELLELLLLETRKTKHATRALANFVLIFFTYEVVAAFFIFVGIAQDDGFGVVFAVVGGLLAVIGVVHTLWSSWREVVLSDD